MQRILVSLLLGTAMAWAQRALPAQPHHLFHPQHALTPESTRAPREIAASYLASLAPQLGLSREDVASVRLIKEYRTAHNGVTHLVYQQELQGLPIHNAEWTVNVDVNGSVLNAGGTLYPLNAAPAAPTLAAAPFAVRAAVRAVNPRLGENFYPFELDTPNRGQRTRFYKGGLGDDAFGAAVWYAADGRLLPAWAFTIVDTDGVNSYEVVVESNGQAILEKEPRTWFQNAPAPPRGLVFEGESPQPNPTPGVALTSLPAYRERTLQSFAGDPVASPKGWVTGTETVGNNVVAGQNREATYFLTTPKTAQSATRDFSFPLQVGPNVPSPFTYADAATTNLFYWANKAHDLHYLAGFDEAAGNYQQDNLGRGGVGGDPLYVYSDFGATDTVFPDLDNAFYTTRRAGLDGAQSMVAMFLASFGGRMFTDGSLDAGVIVHEYTHGVSTRLVRQLTGAQGGAMGEAWSDFFALEYTTPEGAPIDGSYPTGPYFAQAVTGIRTRPYSTDMAVNPLTFGRLGQVITRPEVHADGEIWVEALLEARAALIRQFGEKEGRRRVRLLVMDGMKLSPPAPTMVDMRDAILLADRADFKGESQTQLWAAFARRGLGVLAQSTSTNSTHVAESFETTSPTGKIGFYETSVIQGEPVRIVLHDNNFDAPTALVQVTSSSGDLEDIRLTRTGTAYTGVLGTGTGSAAVKQDGFLSVIPGDDIVAYYLDSNADGITKLVYQSVPTKGAYSLSSTRANYDFRNETALRLRANPRAFTRVDLHFAFPFFGREYRSLRVYNNGLLTFDLPPAPACLDAASLSTYNAIAPLWMEMSTAGSAQPGEDVYVSRPSPDAIAFRWVAETAPTLASGLLPSPVNAAATLYADGRVQLQYGSGNTELAIPSATTACGVSAPVVGVSSGTGYVLSVGGYSRVSDLENATPLVFGPPYGFSSVPTGVLESPKPGDAVQGILSGQGIAYDSDTPLSAVYVRVDGVNVGRATLRVSRPDFCAQQRVTGCPNVGFTFNFDIASLGLKPGTHTIQLRAVNTRYAFTDIPADPQPFEVVAGNSRVAQGAIESPQAGAELSGLVPIRGYVYVPGLRIVNADLLIDGVTYVNLLLTGRRDDICGPLTGVPNCPAIGFSTILDTNAAFVLLPNGPHALQIRVQDETGRFTILPETPINVTVKNNPIVPPAGTLSSPANGATLTGTVRISGLAYVPGSTILQASLLIDGEQRAVIPYGSTRAAACAALPDVAACPNIGFDLDFDTRVLTNGPHVLGIRLLTRNGQSITLPGPVGGLSYGINVLVRN